ncbi:NADH-quinone oxidoreductase subunit L [Limnobacter sp.]|uniref:NADH-quinone oxidoreductase subunit L n=1 Tax=Limnobacter sp. TaxID=2003368 RepID=UPI00351694EE
MNSNLTVFSITALGPVVLMALAATLAPLFRAHKTTLWRVFHGVTSLALLCAVINLLGLGMGEPGVTVTGLKTSTFGLVLAALVQVLGLAIGSFSARYLQGETGQPRYVAALATVLAAVQLLLMADHWLVLIVAWSVVGLALQHLLCFYPDRPFASLAAHKKRLADLLADALLLFAAFLAWLETGTGSLSVLSEHIANHGMSTALHACAVALVLAVVLRTALMPVHGWLIQVMEAPTPVSALLHAGVVNLGGFVLVLFAPLLGQSQVASGLLMVFGLGTAVLAGMVMLTRISIKVRLAWSTVAQMGFMLLECALGLYTLAALHLIGHSLYKAHTFLSASMAVRQTRLKMLVQAVQPLAHSLGWSPAVALAMVWAVQEIAQAAMGTTHGQATWPLWWSALLALAWAPLLWLRPHPGQGPSLGLQGLFGLGMVAGLTGLTVLGHALPLGIADAPQHMAGMLALLGMAALYLTLVLMQLKPHALQRWRRWSYAGFYVDEIYTRIALRIWPARWSAEARRLAA